MIHFALEQEVSRWNKSILANPDGGNIFQTAEFAEQKKPAGWKMRYIATDSVTMTAIEKKIFGLGNIWYIPKGPGVSTIEELTKLVPELTAFAKKQGVFTIKIEPELPIELQNQMAKLGLVPTRPIQPNNNTVLIDLSPSLDDIMMSLNQKGRHAIRRAERDGVTVKKVPASKENCDSMYNLLKDTAVGAGFGIRSPQYYETFWQRYEESGMGQLFFAYFEGQIVAGAYALVFGKKSTYKDGASIRERTAYGASHLLQWHVMQWAKQQGSLTHDLCGSPSPEDAKNPQHPYYGIGLFKTSFNKQITSYVGAYQIPVQPLKSKFWSAYLEKLIRKIYYKKHHESYY
jgi:lipid II:glycine glycyltransferase (peptidoglycan interpeptide bridge formation enzyme)